MRLATPGPLRVMSGQLVVFRRLWRLNVLSSFVQPMLYLLGLGVGVGALVDSNAGSADALGGLPYVAFVAPGLLVTTAMTLCANDSMWPVMGGLKWRREYHGIAATPLGPRDIVLGHAGWMAVRGALAASMVAAALALFPDTRSWGLIPAVGVATLVGVAFAMPTMAIAIGAQTDGLFAALQRFVLLPLFLFGGAFYPLSQLPTVVQWVAKVFPLWHGVVVARGLTTGGLAWGDALGHLGYAVVWVVVGCVVSTRRLAVRLCP
jgi:lipooligosaccharide transport system permease protein